MSFHNNNHHHKFYTRSFWGNKNGDDQEKQKNEFSFAIGIQNYCMFNQYVCCLAFCTMYIVRKKEREAEKKLWQHYKALVHARMSIIKRKKIYNKEMWKPTNLLPIFLFTPFHYTQHLYTNLDFFLLCFSWFLSVLWCLALNKKINLYVHFYNLIF